MSMKNTVLDLINKANNEYSLFCSEQNIGIALSGGKDSVCLLHAMKTLSSEININLYALHFNHGIRGDEADRDEAFCKKTCEELDIPFFSKKENVPKYAKESNSGLEEAARKLRYDFFYFCKKKYNLNSIATAHTLSDSTETMIFNLTRGTGLKGLCGIPPVRDCFIRPLIFVTSKQVEEYIKEHRLECVYDSTNGDTEYKRNRIRHNICPQLKKINPNFETSFGNTSDIIKRDSDFIEKEAQKYRNENKAEILSSLHPALLSRIIINGYNRQKPEQMLTSTQINDIISLLREYKYGKKQLSLPDNILFVINNGIVSFCENNTKEIQLKIPETPLHLGENDFSHFGFRMFLSEGPYDKYSSYQTGILPEYRNLYIRSRQSGDTIRYGGITRKIKKLFNEKIPTDKRETHPVVCDENGIAWIPLFKIRDDLKTKNKKYYIYFIEGEIK